MPTRSELAAAFAATTYRVFLPDGPVDLRVGQENPRLGTWLAEEGVEAWAVLTAWNPGGERREDALNIAAQSALEVKLLEMGYEPFAGENLADAGDWPREDACFVPRLRRERALAVAREFGQAAILCGDSATPNLAWIEGPDHG